MMTPPRSRGVITARAELSYVTRKVMLPVQGYMHAEAAGGLTLLIGTVAGLVLANSPWSAAYHALLTAPLSLDLGIVTLEGTVHHAINDGLMTLFFFIIGLEIKREIAGGDLSTLRKAALPVCAALGGMVVPALLYLAVASGRARGWGIPIATDIAFALGILALLGDRVPDQLKIFFLAFAAADDVGGVLVIALFYAERLSWPALLAAAALVAVIAAVKRAGVLNLGVYTVLGVLLWMAVLKSGVHATIAGVVLGLMTPARPYFSPGVYAEAAGGLLDTYRDEMALQPSDEERGIPDRAAATLGGIEELTRATEEPLDRLDRMVHPWVSFVVLPLFAFANAGVRLSDIGEALSSGATHGILLALLVGKPVGVFGASFLAVKARLTDLPAPLTFHHVAGAGLLAGVGFTVALFIAQLAFAGAPDLAYARIAILTASAVAGVLGFVYLRLRTSAQPPGLNRIG